MLNNLRSSVRGKLQKIIKPRQRRKVNRRWSIIKQWFKHAINYLQDELIKFDKLKLIRTWRTKTLQDPHTVHPSFEVDKTDTAKGDISVWTGKHSRTHAWRKELNQHILTPTQSNLDRSIKLFLISNLFIYLFIHLSKHISRYFCPKNSKMGYRSFTGTHAIKSTFWASENISHSVAR